MRGVDKKINAIVNQIKRYAIEKYGTKIKQVILYGSYVRGEASKHSDIDVLIVVDKSLIPSEVRDTLSDLLYDILLEEEELVSVLVVSEPFFKGYNSPFLLNVKDEGIIA